MIIYLSRYPDLANKELRTTAQTSPKEDGAIKTGYQQADL
jgi:hypothetical protein